jgi:uncharacterized alkaline shock family protein YloU
MTPRLEQQDRDQTEDSLDGSGESVPAAGKTELGRIDVRDRVVEKIVAAAATEVSAAGAPSPQLLGRTIARVGLGSAGPGTELSRAPKVSATVDGRLAFVDVKLSVRWPTSLTSVTEAVRRRIVSRVSDLLGLTVQEINVTVVDLVTDITTNRVA